MSCVMMERLVSGGGQPSAGWHTRAMNISEARAQLAEVSHILYARGWVPATSGNFSLRLDDGDIAITSSGRDKGVLNPEEIMRVGTDGKSKEDQTPSAEAALHTQLYTRDPGICAVLHTHSVNAALVSTMAPDGVEFSGLEILKAFAGINTHATSIYIPVFANNQNTQALATEVEQHMQSQGQGVAYLIAGHGVYTWGRNLGECLKHLEALEYLFDYHRLSAKA